MSGAKVVVKYGNWCSFVAVFVDVYFQIIWLALSPDLAATNEAKNIFAGMNLAWWDVFWVLFFNE